MSYNTELQNNNAELQAILEMANNLPEAGESVTDAVRYTEQILTDAQKAQARENIAALGESDLQGAVNDALSQAKASGEFDGKDGTNGTNGKDGTSVTVTNVSTSTADGGDNVVTFSDGKTLTIKNGSTGKSAYAYAQDGGYTGTEAQYKELLANAVDKRKISLGLHTDGLIYLFIDGSPVGNGIALPSGGVSGDVVGNVDSANNIVLTGNLADGTYKLKYEYDDGDVREAGSIVINSIVTYSITKTLSNCTASGATTINKGSTATITLTANSGYKLPDSITVSGANHTWDKASGKIVLSNPTGNVAITVTAVSAGPTNLADPTSAYWKDGYRLSIGSGGTSACAGHTVTNFIPAKMGDVLRVKGMSIKTTLNSQDSKIVWYSTKDTESSKIGGMYGTTATTANTAYANKVAVNGAVSEYTLAYDNNGTQAMVGNANYIRIDGVLLDGYTKNDVIITINEEIV